MTEREYNIEVLYLSIVAERLVIAGKETNKKKTGGTA